MSAREFSPPDTMADVALRVADHTPAMLAYWNRDLICEFANEAYRAWFGKSRAEVVGSSMRALLGPLFELNLPYINGVLAGQPQQFERTIPVPGGGEAVRESLATYTPDIVDGTVRGFYVHVADVTDLKRLEAEQRRLIAQLETALHAVHTLEGLLPICGHCKKIRDQEGRWTAVETYIRSRTATEFSHTICPDCLKTHYPDQL